MTVGRAVFVMGRPEAAGPLKESVFAVGLLPHHYQCVQLQWLNLKKFGS